jgi:hypothetical protein
MRDESVHKPLAELRAASDAVLVMSDLLRAVEEERSGTDPADARRPALDEEATQLARRLVDVTRAETNVAREVSEGA